MLNTETLLTHVKKEPLLKVEDEETASLEEGTTLSIHVVEPDSKGKSLIAEIMNQQKKQEQQLEDLVKRQSKITASDRDEFNELQQLLFKLHQQIATQLKELNDLFRKEVLPSVELGTIEKLVQILHLQQQRVDLYRQELGHIANGDKKRYSWSYLLHNPSVATLTIIEQPVSQIVFKGRTIEGKYVVQLLPGAKVEIETPSVVQASISDEESWKSNKPIAVYFSPYY